MKRIDTSRLRAIATAIILIAILLLLLKSCILFEDPGKDKPATDKDHIYASFQEWYLWYDQIPDIDPNAYASYTELIDTIAVEQDRWSFAGSYSAIKKLIEEAESKSFGGGFILDFDGEIKITHVYRDSPFGKFGVERGWIVESINGYTKSNLDEVNKALNSNESVQFEFIDLNGEKKSQAFQKETFSMNTVLYANIYEVENHKIGYLVFDGFWEVSEAELKKEFEVFQKANITELIVDLRYNGGGSVPIAEMLIGMIGGTKVDGKVITNVVHNDKKKLRNSSTKSNYKGPKVEIDQVVFLTTDGSASSSELVINSLEPYMDVTIVGSATHGKPVGMYVLSVEALDLAILPISFKSTNAEGYGDYYDGLPADISEIDDLSHNWGQPDEAMLNTAINSITEPDVIAASVLKSSRIKQQKLFDVSRLNLLVKPLE